MKTSPLAVVLACLAGVLPCEAADRAWEIRGELEVLRSGTPQIAVLRLVDGRRIEVSIDALSEASQAAVHADAAALLPVRERGVTVRGPSGRTVRLDVAEVIKDVEADAVRCRSAKAAADVYRLFLASGQVTPEQRSAAESRARYWGEKSEAGLVRLGDRWLPPAEAAAVKDEAKKILAHALELMRLGNADLAEGELRKASRLDPDSGRANFVTGLAYACVANKPEKAVEQFAVVTEREPRNAPALNDLAVLEVLTRRHGAIARHFRQAVENAVDPRPVADNIAWAVKLSGAAKIDPTQGRYRMPERTIEELNVLYRLVTQELKLKPWDNVAAPQYLGPDGTSCTAATLADVAALFEATAEGDAEAHATLGFAVAPDHVVCPRQAITRADGSVLSEVSVELPTDRRKRVTAIVVAVPENGDVALLQCDGLETKPLSLAEGMSTDSRIFAVDRTEESWLNPLLAAAPGTIIEPAGQSADHGRFLHTAIVPRGPGGGPIVDEAGAVVGMVASTPQTDTSGNSAGFGISVDQIRSLLKEHAPDAGGSADDAVAGPAEAGTHAVAGTVVVVATTPKPEATVAEPSSPP